MTHPLLQAIEICGGLSKLAAAIGVTPQTVSNWTQPNRRVPAEQCPPIERATGGVVRCEALRPDIEWGVLREQASEPAKV